MTLRTKIDGLKEIWHFDNRYYLAFSRIFFPRESVHLYKYKNIDFLTDHLAGDANGAREVLTSQMYRKFLNRMDLTGELKVLDLGSNNGGFPLLLKSEGFQIAKLACVEMNPNTFARLNLNLRRNFGKIYTALNYALSGSPREFQLELGSGGASDSIYGTGATTPDGTYSISGKTFDDIYGETFQGESIDVCKMDVEGAEFEVFAGTSAEKLRNCRYLLIEIHHEAERPRDVVIKSLEAMGFGELFGENSKDELHHVHLFANRDI